ncbi:hypothetical protein O181_082642 [Austropuccinia psidii MF-1]|uniref:Uncharacterized protein n=1 Tax=Austropuccinia psidii MF-1 TaxID=1389203 RepID=A0A9Q3FSX9_9BASI|nr:hypothetical protein [Austropuccinia psidii MF-1]
MDESKPVLPQEVTRSTIGLSKTSQPKASLKKEDNKIQKIQPFPLNMVNIDPRLIMQDKDITQQNLQNSKIRIRKSEQDLSKELIKKSKEESEYPHHLKTFNPHSKVKKQIQPGNKAIKKERTAEKESYITKNEDPIKPKHKYSTNIRNNIEQDFTENHSQPNRICSQDPIKFSTDPRKEDSPSPHHHSDKDHTNLNLRINYFSLDKAKEIQMNKNEEINEGISIR